MTTIEQQIAEAIDLADQQAELDQSKMAELRRRVTHNDAVLAGQFDRLVLEHDQNRAALLQSIADFAFRYAGVPREKGPEAITQRADEAAQRLYGGPVPLPHQMGLDAPLAAPRPPPTDEDLGSPRINNPHHDYDWSNDPLNLGRPQQQ